MWARPSETIEATNAQFRASSKRAPGQLGAVPSPTEAHEVLRVDRFPLLVRDVEADIGVTSALVGCVAIEVTAAAPRQMTDPMESTESGNCLLTAARAVIDDARHQRVEAPANVFALVAGGDPKPGALVEMRPTDEATLRGRADASGPPRGSSRSTHEEATPSTRAVRLPVARSCAASRSRDRGSRAPPAANAKTEAAAREREPIAEALFPRAPRAVGAGKASRSRWKRRRSHLLHSRRRTTPPGGTSRSIGYGYP